MRKMQIFQDILTAMTNIKSYVAEDNKNYILFSRSKTAAPLMGVTCNVPTQR